MYFFANTWEKVKKNMGHGSPDVRHVTQIAALNITEDLSLFMIKIKKDAVIDEAGINTAYIPNVNFLYKTVLKL